MTLDTSRLIITSRGRLHYVRWVLHFMVKGFVVVKIERASLICRYLPFSFVYNLGLDCYPTVAKLLINAKLACCFVK